METYITGYQWGANSVYIGTYSFPDNKDNPDYLHMPPNTTLEVPPTVASGEEAYWNGNSWSIRTSTSIPQPVMYEGVVI